MIHKIRDAERRRIGEALSDRNQGYWIAIASEIDYARNQIYFWFLIENANALRRAADNVMTALRPFVIERPGAEFNVGFIELTDELKIDWDTIDDAELRRGNLGRPLGRDPRRMARPTSTVFDRPHYVVPESQEP